MAKNAREEIDIQGLEGGGLGRGVFSSPTFSVCAGMGRERCRRESSEKSVVHPAPTGRDTYSKNAIITRWICGFIWGGGGVGVVPQRDNNHTTNDFVGLKDSSSLF
jgi:hypothetical protein